MVEVTEKDWAAELEDFKDKVINIKVDDLVSKDINTNQEEGLKEGIVYRWLVVRNHRLIYK